MVNQIREYREALTHLANQILLPLVILLQFTDFSAELFLPGFSIFLFVLQISLKDFINVSLRLIGHCQLTVLPIHSQSANISQTGHPIS